MPRQGDQRTDTDTGQAGLRCARRVSWRNEVRCGNPNRTLASVSQLDNHVGRAAPRTLIEDRKSMTEQEVARVRDRDVRHYPIKNSGALRYSAFPRSPTPSSTASFTTPIASIWPARACASGRPRPEIDPARRRPARPTLGARRRWITARSATAQWRARSARRYPPPLKLLRTSKSKPA